MYVMAMWVQIAYCDEICYTLATHNSQGRSTQSGRSSHGRTGFILRDRMSNKYFELKNLWGAGAPLNSNYLPNCYFKVTN